MDVISKNFPVVMARDNLDDIPHYDLPDGYSVRWFAPGDENAWIKVQRAAEKYIKITRELWENQFGQENSPVADRQAFIVDAAGEAIGTGTAWCNDHNERPMGQVHWIAIVPEKQGLGLAKPLMSVVCERPRELGHDSAFLATSSSRIPAINLYRSFGFGPELKSAQEKEVWEAICKQIELR